MWKVSQQTSFIPLAHWIHRNPNVTVAPETVSKRQVISSMTSNGSTSCQDPRSSSQSAAPDTASKLVAANHPCIRGSGRTSCSKQQYGHVHSHLSLQGETAGQTIVGQRRSRRTMRRTPSESGTDPSAARPATLHRKVIFLCTPLRNGLTLGAQDASCWHETF